MAIDLSQSKRKILIVDDDSFLLNMYSMKFGKSGYDVTALPSGREALEKLKAGFSPDVVILDMIMPGMDGLETLTEIRRGRLAADAVVVILTNQGEPADIERAKALGIQGYIVKATSIPSEVVEEVGKIWAAAHPGASKSA